MEKQESAIIRLQVLGCLTLGDHNALRQQARIMCQHVISGVTVVFAYACLYFCQVSFYQINVTFYLNKLSVCVLLHCTFLFLLFKKKKEFVCPFLSRARVCARTHGVLGLVR